MNDSLIEIVRRHFWPALLLLAAAFAVYGRIIGHDFIYNWDDSFYVINNEAVRGFSLEHLQQVFTRYYVGNYAPVQMLSYMLDYTLWGPAPGGYYCTNIVIHALNAILLYFLLYRLQGDRFPALLGAAFFLSHPVQVEVVAWISQRKTLLSMFFFLLSWLLYSRFRESAPGKGRFFYALAVTSYLLALLAKSVAVILPLVLFFHDLCFQREAKSGKILNKLPFALAAAVFAAVSLYSQQPEEDNWMGQGGGIVPYHGGSRWSTFLTMLTVFCRYLRMLVWPVNLNIIYKPTVHHYFNLQVAAASLLLLVIVLISWRLYLADRRLGFWALLPWIGLLPVAQIVPLTTIMNDRYLYFPMIGVAALYGSGMVFLRQRILRQRNAILCTAAIPLLLLAVMSCNRAGVWRSPITLWQDAASKDPGNPLVMHQLAEAYYKAVPPMKEEALTTYLRTAELDPTMVSAWYNLGILYKNRSEYNEAYEAVQNVLQLSPDHIMGLTLLGEICRERGDYAEAEQAFQRALALQPDAYQIVISMGNLALAQGKLPLAQGYFFQTEERLHDPESAFKLACTFALSGRKDEAFSWLEKALQRGFAKRELLDSGKELAALRSDPRFVKLVRRYLPETGK